MTQVILAKRSATFGHRFTAMLENGYQVVHMSMAEPQQVYKLRHRANGNIVMFFVNLHQNHMVQKKNGKVVYEGIIQP